MRKLVDVITLTATPIPRTLQMAVSGIRDLSLIQTPPENRLSIRTFVIRYDDEVIREAIQREFDRGGQVFFVHHRVQNIHTIANHLKAAYSRGLPGHCPWSDERKGIGEGDAPIRQEGS